jgi:hypothetical protein
LANVVPGPPHPPYPPYPPFPAPPPFPPYPPYIIVASGSCAGCGGTAGGFVTTPSWTSSAPTAQQQQQPTLPSYPYSAPTVGSVIPEASAPQLNTVPPLVSGSAPPVPLPGSSVITTLDSGRADHSVNLETEGVLILAEQMVSLLPGILAASRKERSTT